MPNPRKSKNQSFISLRLTPRPSPHNHRRWSPRWSRGRCTRRHPWTCSPGRASHRWPRDSWAHTHPTHLAAATPRSCLLPGISQFYVGGNNTGLKIKLRSRKNLHWKKECSEAATEKNYCSPLVVPRTIVGLLFFFYLRVFLLVNVLCKSNNSVWFYLT
jgi:hypothetical protein